MAFSNYEVTPSAGFPIEAYDFYFNGQHHRYVHHDEDITTPQEGVWAATRITRSSFTRGMEVDQAGITLTMDREVALVQAFDEGVPESTVELTVYRMHADDPDQEKWEIWSGQVTSRKRLDKEVQFVCEAPEVSLRTMGLRRRYQRTCPYPIYGVGCGVDKTLYRTNATISSVTQAGSVLRVDVADCSPYAGGLLTAIVDGSLRFRHIAEGSGDSLTLIRPVGWGFPGLSLALYPGCGKTLEICWNKFNNGLNFGGFAFMPEDSPFTTQVY